MENMRQAALDYFNSFQGNPLADWSSRINRDHMSHFNLTMDIWPTFLDHDPIPGSQPKSINSQPVRPDVHVDQNKQTAKISVFSLISKIAPL